MEITPDELAQGALSPEKLQVAARTFRETGLFVLQGAYSRERIAEVRSAYEKELDLHIQEQGGLAALEGKTFGRNHIGFFPPMRLPLASAEFAAHPVGIQVMDSLLGPDYVCSFFHTNTAYPGSGIQPVHRDTGDLFPGEMGVPLPPYVLVANVTLCDFTEENGSTEVWPGTHLVVDRSPDDSRDLEARAELMPSVRTNVSAGSLILRDLRCWHRGMPNNANYARSMLALIFQRGWLSEQTVDIPRTTWESWPERVQHIYRKNRVVEDAGYKPRTWKK